MVTVTGTSVTKLIINENSIYISTVWKPNTDDLFHIKIYDGEKSWSGKFSNEIARKYWEQLDETENEYSKNVLDCLLKKGDFIYSFQSKDNNTAVFSWKKKFLDPEFGLATLVYGTVSLEMEETCKDFLLDFLIEENKELRNHTDNIIAKTEKLERDLKQYKCYLEQLTDLKSSLEKSLYSKFAQLLATKKRRIQELENNISKFAKHPKIEAVMNNIVDHVEGAD